MDDPDNPNDDDDDCYHVDGNYKHTSILLGESTLNCVCHRH